MGRTVDWSSVPDSNILPVGLYKFEIEEIKEEVSKAGKLMYTGTFRVVEPELHAGTPYFERFNIGSDDDPSADDPQTWTKSIGARILKRVFRAAMVPLGDDVDEMIQVARGQHVVAAMQQEVDDGKRDPKYKGQIRNRVAAWYPLGEKEVTPGAEKPVVAPAAPVAAKPAAKAAVSAKVAGRVPTVKCGGCGESIPRSEYMKHLADVHPETSED